MSDGDRGVTEPSHEGPLSALVGAVRETLRRSALTALLSWLAALVAVGLVLAWVLADPEGWRRGSAMPLFLDMGILLVGAAAVVAFVSGIRRRLTDARVADGLDGVVGLGRGTVRSALELSRSTPPGVSDALIRRSEERVMGSLSGDSASLADPLSRGIRRWAGRGGAVLAVTGALLAILVLASPERAFSAWEGLLRPGRVLATPTLPPLSVEPGHDSLPRGSDVLLSVRAPGRDRVLVRWQFDGDVARTRTVPVEDGAGSTSLGALEAPVEYRVEAADGAATERFRLTPLDPLLLTDLRVELLFPRHTGLAPRQFQREVPPLEIPAGTRIRFEGRASRMLARASLQRVEEDAGEGAAGGEGPRVELEVDEDRFSGEWVPREGGRWAWMMDAGGTGETGALPPPLEIELVPDSTPSVALLFPGRDTVLALDRRQPLVIESRDDYGIASLELVARRVSATGEEGDPVVEGLRAAGLRSVVARPVLDVAAWELIPGDTVRYLVRVTDNSPGRQTATTREYALRVPRRSEAARVVQEELEDVTEQVDSLRSRAERAARETRELERQGVRQRQTGAGSDQANRRQDATGRPESSDRQDASFQDRESARQALERQEGLASQADSIRQELQRMRRALEEGAVVDEELRRNLEELESLMERAAPEEMREEGSRLSEELDEMDPSQLQDAVERMAERQEELRDRIEESLDRFRRAAAEQDFRNTARETRDLAREEEALADAVRSGDDDPRRAEQQRELAEESRRLQDRMESLEERLDDLGEEDARQGVRGARERAEEASGAMERTAQQLSRDGATPESTSSAAEDAESAYEDLERSADDLDRARQEMQERARDERQQALERTASEALALARRQADIEEQIRGRSSREQNEARGDQSAVVEGIENLSENLDRAQADQGAEDEEVEQALEDARRSAEQVLQSLQRSSSGNPSPSQAASETVERLNQVARAANEGTQRQQGGGQQSQQSSGGQTGQQLQQMAERQAGLSDRSGSIQAMELGQASRERQLRQIAAEQGRLGRELGQMAVRPGTDGQVLGDLRSLAREARDLARELEGDRLDTDVVRRQERLFHRLLDAGRSLENDEFSSERESRSAERVDPVDVEALTIEDTGGARFPLPRPEVLQSLPPAQRALVVRYFERLNRTDADDPAAPGSP